MAVANTDIRIEQGWKACRSWIASFDGSPTITLLVGVPDKAMFPALASLSKRAEDFRITAIPVSQPESAQFISLEAFPEHLTALRAETIADLNVNYAHRSEAFDLDIHLTVFAAENQQLVLELVWWSDQVFSEEADDHEQFRQLMAYYIDLQELFSASHLMVSSESTRGPGLEAEDWIEI
jgi:hypothetical protein